MSQTARNYGLIQSIDQLKLLVAKLIEADRPVGFDLESGYLGPDRIKGSLDTAWELQFIVGFSLSGDKSWARYVPLAHDLATNFDPAEVWPIMKPLLEQGKIVAHHAKFEEKNLAKVGITMRTFADSMLDSYVLSETPRHGLKELVKTHFDHDMTNISELFPDLTADKLKALRFNVLPLSPEVVSYACEDAAWCLALYELTHERAVERKLIHSVEMEISTVMADVEQYGVAVDWEGIKAASVQGETFSALYETKVKSMLSDLANRDLFTMNLGSTKQLKELLYAHREDGGLGLRTTRMTKGGKSGSASMSTDAIALERLSRDIPAIKKLLEMREIKNLTGRLQKWLDEYHYSGDNRVHPSFGQVIVPTGRFAANDPAIQQLPKTWHWTTETTVDITKKENQEIWNEITAEANNNGKTYWLGNFRDFIIADPGNYLLTYDYSQVELRILAGESQEPALLKAFANGDDVHSLTAAMMLGKPVAELEKDDRAIGKTMNFALLYQMGVKSLAERLAITQERADELYAAYFTQFTRVATWMEMTKAKGKRQGYVETYFGRKCTVWELQSDNRAIYSKAERVMVNYPIQGGAADYMKIAMVRVVRRLKELGWWNNGCTIVMNQHDSLSFEVSNDLDPNEVRKELEAKVVFPIKNFPPIRADWELGQRWGSSTPWKPEASAVWDGQCWVVESDTSHVNQAVVPSTLMDHTSVETPVTPTVTTTGRDAQVIQLPVTKPRTLLVEIGQMPTVEQFQKLLGLLSANVGQNTVRLVTPEGELPLETGTSLTDADQASFSLALGGARILTPPSEVDPSAVTEGLDL